MMGYLIGLCIVENYVYFYFKTERKSPDFVLAVTYGVGRDVAQAVSRWPLTMNAPVPAQRSPCGICDGQIGTRTGISKLFCFPCQCHSTVAQYSYISCGMWYVACWWPQFRDIESPLRNEQQQHMS
jgi:hypothetical protein